MSEVKITRGLLEQSIEEHEQFIKMVCLNKYGHEDVKDVIEGVIEYCEITNKKQKELLRSGKFLPAGSILSCCNKGERGSFSNCYLTPIESDSMDGIFECQKNLANTFKMRGGSGFDITILRPKNTKVDNAAITSSGSVSFLPSFSELGKVVGTNGRRAAMIATIDIRHPDAIDFIRCKAWPEQVFQKDIFTNSLPDISSINVSLKLTDSFMTAIENDEEWVFCFPDIEKDKEKYEKEWGGDYDKWFKSGGEFKYYSQMKARDILDLIAEASHKCGDPGVMFIDTAQKHTFGTYISDKLKPISSNPCGEQMLSYWNNCLLGSFVLHKYVKNPYTELAEFDWYSFEYDVETATRIMNVFSDINETKHPLPEQQLADSFGKRIGIEQTGIGDTFAMLGYVYGDKESEEFISSVTSILLSQAMRTSVDIAVDEGPCEALSERSDRVKFVEAIKKSGWIELDDDLTENIITFGMRNTSFNTFGPTGTLSIISDNCTSGIEPSFKFSYRRKNRIDNKEYEFIHYLPCKQMLNDLDSFDGISLKEAKNKLCYIEADEVKPKDRIKIQSAIQKFTDSSISSTINLPNNCTKNQIVSIYIDAWKKKLKGITVFRDGCKEGVLSAVIDNENTVPKEITESILIKKELLPIENAERHEVMWKKSKAYLNVSLDEDDLPIEVFTKLPLEAGNDKDGMFNSFLLLERQSNWDAICRVISMCFRYGISLDEVLKQLDKSSYSMVDCSGILSRVLRRYVKQIEIEDENDEIGLVCPECGEKAYVNDGGCASCKNCGFSRCG